jgi:hypothetical protein
MQKFTRIAQQKPHTTAADRECNQKMHLGHTSDVVLYLNRIFAMEKFAQNAQQILSHSSSACCSCFILFG